MIGHWFKFFGYSNCGRCIHICLHFFTGQEKNTRGFEAFLKSTLRKRLRGVLWKASKPKNPGINVELKMGETGISRSFSTVLLNFLCPKKQVGNWKSQNGSSLTYHPKIQSCKDETASTEIKSFNSQFTQPTVPITQKCLLGKLCKKITSRIICFLNASSNVRKVQLTTNHLQTLFLKPWFVQVSYAHGMPLHTGLCVLCFLGDRMIPWLDREVKEAVGWGTTKKQNTSITLTFGGCMDGPKDF